MLEAEGDKKSAELQSEGEKIKMTNESEGTLIKVRNEALARKTQLTLEGVYDALSLYIDLIALEYNIICLCTGEGEAAVIELKAKAHAQAISIIAQAIAQPNGLEAARLAVAREYINMYADMGQKSNTMIFSEHPADMNALLAQASAVIQASSASGAQKPQLPLQIAKEV